MGEIIKCRESVPGGSSTLVLLDGGAGGGSILQSRTLPGPGEPRMANTLSSHDRAPITS